MVKTISVPKTPRSAYNPKRNLSGLLKAHIANLEAMRPRQFGVAAAAPRKPRSEGQASAYIAELTQQLHPPVQDAPAPAPAPVAFAPSAAMDDASPVPTAEARKYPSVRVRKKATGRATKAARRPAGAARGGKGKLTRGVKR